LPLNEMPDLQLYFTVLLIKEHLSAFRRTSMHGAFYLLRKSQIVLRN